MRTRFLNVDVDLKCAKDPEPLLRSLGARVLAERLGRAGRRHWVRFTLARHPESPVAAVRAVARLVGALSADGRAVWDTAASRELDIGIQAGLEPGSGEWVLDRTAVAAASRIGAQLRITVYPPHVRAASRIRRRARVAMRR